MALADLIVVMNDGRIEQAAHPRTVFETPATAFVARFMGDHNVISGRGHPPAQRGAKLWPYRRPHDRATGADWREGYRVCVACRRCIRHQGCRQPPICCLRSSIPIPPPRRTMPRYSARPSSYYRRCRACRCSARAPRLMLKFWNKASATVMIRVVDRPQLGSYRLGTSLSPGYLAPEQVE